MPLSASLSLKARLSSGLKVKKRPGSKLQSHKEYTGFVFFVLKLKNSLNFSNELQSYSFETVVYWPRFRSTVSRDASMIA